MKLLRLNSPAAVAQRAADLVAVEVARRPDAVLVVPAGNTPVALYAELARRRCGEGLDLSRVRFVQLDEVIGFGREDPRSFRRFLAQHLLGPLGRYGSEDLLLDGAAADPAAEIARHAVALAELGGADLVLLGIGVNGHVAFNEPGTHVEDGARVVTLAPATVRHLAAAGGAPPTHGMTLGPREILRARRIALLGTGAPKAAAIGELARGAEKSELPASLLLRHPDFTVLADADAGGELDRDAARS